MRAKWPSAGPVDESGIGCENFSVSCCTRVTYEVLGPGIEALSLIHHNWVKLRSISKEARSKGPGNKYTRDQRVAAKERTREWKGLKTPGKENGWIDERFSFKMDE
jgi:hypothetical protein